MGVTRKHYFYSILKPKKMCNIIINTELFLRRVVLSDANAIFETINSQRTYLRKWLPFIDYTREIEDSIRFIKAVYKDEENVYVLNYQNNFAGLIGFRETDNFNKKTEIGYWLSEPFQKKGIVTNAVKALVKHAFTELDIHRIEINCAAGNEASSRIPQKLGFLLEGIERDGELLSDGLFVNLERYSLLKSDRVNWL